MYKHLVVHEVVGPACAVELSPAVGDHAYREKQATSDNKPRPPRNLVLNVSDISLKAPFHTLNSKSKRVFLINFLGENEWFE